MDICVSARNERLLALEKCKCNYALYFWEYLKKFACMLTNVYFLLTTTTTRIIIIIIIFIISSSSSGSNNTTSI